MVGQVFDLVCEMCLIGFFTPRIVGRPDPLADRVDFKREHQTIESVLEEFRNGLNRGADGRRMLCHGLND